jgi:diguanylate cyclase (GGDEF)-like protein
MALRADTWCLADVGAQLERRAEAILDDIEARNAAKGVLFSPEIEANLRRAGIVATVAVARSVAGRAGGDASRAAAAEVGGVFGVGVAAGELAFDEIVKRCLRWRDATGDVLEEIFRELDAPNDVRVTVLTQIHRALDATLVLIARAFEHERASLGAALAERERELMWRATHDPLTKLKNRRELFEELERVLSDATAPPTLLVLCDLNGFKEYNDRLGHFAGDRMLERLAQRLVAAVEANGNAYRAGGDEFCVVAGMDEEGWNLCDRVAKALTHAGRSGTPITCSYGAVSLPDEAASPEEALRLADARMYEHKARMSRKSRRPRTRAASG